MNFQLPILDLFNEVSTLKVPTNMSKLCQIKVLNIDYDHSGTFWLKPLHPPF